MEAQRLLLMIEDGPDQQQSLPVPSAEDLGWTDYRVHNEEEGMAFQNQCAEE